MGTDRYAYASALRRMDPLGKLFLTAVAAVICLCCDSILTGICTLGIMMGLTAVWGKVKPGVFLHFLKVPLAFLVIGCLTILVERHAMGTPLLAGVPIGGSLWGISAQGALRGTRIFCKAMGVVSAMYFLSLNTPVVDLTQALRRLHVPQLMIELMDLIYRFIFVLTDGAARIRVAQDSRLGYEGFRRSMDSAGTLLSMVFLRAWRKGDSIYSALEARGYQGELKTLNMGYDGAKACYWAAGAVAAAQLLCVWMEGGLLL